MKNRCIAVESRLRRVRNLVMWTDDQLSLLITERRNKNADYHNIPGSSRVRFWNDIANIINERFSTNYTGYQCKGKFQNLVRDHTVSIFYEALIDRLNHK